MVKKNQIHKVLYQTSNKVNSHSVVNSRVSIEAARSLRGSVCGTLLSVDDKQVIDNCQLFQLIVMKWGNLSSQTWTRMEPLLQYEYVTKYHGQSQNGIMGLLSKLVRVCVLE